MSFPHFETYRTGLRRSVSGLSLTSWLRGRWLGELGVEEGDGGEERMEKEKRGVDRLVASKCEVHWGEGFADYFDANQHDDDWG
jgi:hypothetical protein